MEFIGTEIVFSNGRISILDGENHVFSSNRWLDVHEKSASLGMTNWFIKRSTHEGKHNFLMFEKEVCSSDGSLRKSEAQALLKEDAKALVSLLQGYLSDSGSDGAVRLGFGAPELVEE